MLVCNAASQGLVESHDSSMTAQLSTHTRTPLAHAFHAQAEPHYHTCSGAHQPHTILHSHACTHAEESSRTTAASTRFTHSKQSVQAVRHHPRMFSQPLSVAAPHTAPCQHVCLSLCVNAPPSAAPNPTCTRPHTPPPFRAAPLAQHSTALANQPATPHRASRVLRPSSSSLATSGALCPAAMGATTPPSPYAPYCA